MSSNPYDKYRNVSTHDVLNLDSTELRSLYNRGIKFYAGRLASCHTLLHTLVHQELVKRRALNDSTTEH